MTTIADTSLAIETADAENAAELERRYAFYRMLNATDRVLNRLEELNLLGVASVTEDARLAIDRELAQEDLTLDVVGLVVQELLDGVFEIQTRMFKRRHPWAFEPDEEALV